MLYGISHAFPIKLCKSRVHTSFGHSKLVVVFLRIKFCQLLTLQMVTQIVCICINQTDSDLFGMAEGHDTSNSLRHCCNVNSLSQIFNFLSLYPVASGNSVLTNSHLL